MGFYGQGKAKATIIAQSECVSITLPSACWIASPKCSSLNVLSHWVFMTTCNLDTASGQETEPRRCWVQRVAFWLQLRFLICYSGGLWNRSGETAQFQYLGEFSLRTHSVGHVCPWHSDRRGHPCTQWPLSALHSYSGPCQNPFTSSLVINIPGMHSGLARRPKTRLQCLKQDIMASAHSQCAFPQCRPSLPMSEENSFSVGLFTSDCLLPWESINLLMYFGYHIFRSSSLIIKHECVWKALFCYIWSGHTL